MHFARNIYYYNNINISNIVILIINNLLALIHFVPYLNNCSGEHKGNGFPGVRCAHGSLVLFFPFLPVFSLSLCRQIPACFLSPSAANCSPVSTVGQALISATWGSQ